MMMERAEAVSLLIEGWLNLRALKGRTDIEKLSIDTAVEGIATALRLLGIEPNDYLDKEDREAIRRKLFE